jgi:hypothetical protein
MDKKAIFSLLIVGLIGGGFYYDHLQKERKKAVRLSTAKKLEKVLKLNKLKVRNKVEVSIVKKMQPKCWVGDADVLVEDLDQKSQDDFLITLESLSKPDMSESVKINLQTFFDQPITEIDLPLSKFKGNHALGLFICSDSEGKGTCRGKKIQDVMDLYGNYVREEVIHVASDKKLPFRIALFQNKVTPEVEKHIATDHVYYFQYIYISGGKLIFPKENIAKASYYNNLGKYEQKVLGLRKDIKNRIKYAFKSNKDLKNYAMSTMGKKLAINIPNRNRDCILGYEQTQQLLKKKGVK